MEVLHLLAGTLLIRPYVFIFLGVYLALAVPAWGWSRSLVYTLLGYTLAWAAEYSSIHNGFPFGHYIYIQEPTRDKELWVLGVPFMDSLSFVFLTYAGLHMSRLVLEPVKRGPLGSWDIRWASPRWMIDLGTWLIAGLFTVGLDIVIDPLALRGERWFLGQIYQYSQHGRYFGVPLSNFIGWVLLAWTIIGLFGIVDRTLLTPRLGVWRSYAADALLGMLLFVGVLAFNLTLTFMIDEILLGLIGCAWAALMLLPGARRLLSSKERIV